MLKGAIFDLDGVLLDSMFIWRDLGVRYLNSIGINAERKLGEILFPMSMEQGADYLKNRYKLAQSVDEILERLREMLEDFYLYEVEEKGEAKRLINELHSRNIRMIAATSSPRSHVTAALERLEILPFLDGILTTSEVGESKHSPKIYRLAAEKLGTEHGETLVFEDSLYALKTAKSDGFVTVGVYDEYGESNQAELEATADVYLKSLREFEKIFKK